jgi:hypothetical protein
VFSHRAVAQPSPATRPAGPFLVIVPAIIAVRAPSMGMMLSAFFENDALVWITGSLLLFGGLLIIAHHQYWSSPAAILISLFGWFLALRGLVLLARTAAVCEWRRRRDEYDADRSDRVRLPCASRPVAHLCRLDRQVPRQRPVDRTTPAVAAGAFCSYPRSDEARCIAAFTSKMPDCF